MIPSPDVLFDAIEATWPAAQIHRVGPWTIRDGQGGGKRVAAITADGPWTFDDIAQAETAQDALDQPHLFMLRPGQDALDQALASRGYQVIDPVVIFACPTPDLMAQTPPLSTFPIWPPLAIMAEIWNEGGIGAARLDVMHRAGGPKTAILGRHNDHPVATTYVALHKEIAMLHALEVRTSARRNGVGLGMMHAAANWAHTQGAPWFALMTTRENAPALGLYTSLGMQVMGHYHYRIK
ncbi:MAG: GNAT superfamily N-acetyltransferase [Paracoccaceae bacterium]|jgi:GNAT superfamily N-acetyltransferase